MNPRVLSAFAANTYSRILLASKLESHYMKTIEALTSEGRKQILAALRPLGSDYAAVINRSLDERWVDMYPTEGKRSGAYSNGGAAMPSPSSARWSPSRRKCCAPSASP